MPAVSFDRASRLRSSEGYRRAIKTGTRSSSDSFTLVCVEEKNTQTPGRVLTGFQVSKRAAKKAVTRNRLRRLLKEALRVLAPDFPPETSSVVVVVNKIPKALSLEEITKELMFCLEQLHKK